MADSVTGSQPTVDVQVVTEPSASPARPASEFKFPFAGQADIVRASQKDLHYQQRLHAQISDLVQETRGTRYFAKHQAGIAAWANFAYHGLTTLAGAPTLGEEYCGILQIDPHRVYPSLGRRVLMVVLHSAGGLAAARVLAAVRVWLRQRQTQRQGGSGPGLVERALARVAAGGADGLLARLGMAHLVVFYFAGAFYGLAKRVAGIRYVFPRRLGRGEEAMGYEALGALLAVQLVVQTALQLRGAQAGAEVCGEDGDEDGGEACSWADVDAGGEKGLEGNGSATDEKRVELAGAELHDEEKDHGEEELEEKCALDTADAPIDDEEIETIRRFVSSEHPCTLCLSARSHPASTPCGHMFCWTCVFEWCQTRAECPLCRQPVRLNQIMPVFNY